MKIKWLESIRYLLEKYNDQDTRYYGMIIGRLTDLKK